MSDTVVRIKDVSKQYKLGEVGTGSLLQDLNVWWHLIRGKENPNLKIGDLNDRTVSSKNPFVWALQNISFDINRGEVIGIIGRNGAGKSTLLKILSRTTLPTTGSMKVKGRLSSLLEVGTGFHPELSGRDNIFLNGAILGMQKAEIKNKFDAIVDFSGVEKYIDTPVKRYSSGMYVRLAFAVAAHLESEILIVDEVLAVGDSEFQKKCLGKMKDASSKEGRTVLFVSHNMPAVQNLCTHGIVLDKGRQALEKAPVDDALNFYRNTIVGVNAVGVTDWSQRSGTGIFKFQTFEFLDAQNLPILSPVCGNSLKVRIKATTSQNLNNVSVAIAFYAVGGECKLMLWSELVDSNYNIEKGESVFECYVDRFPLSKGNYSINLFAASYNETLDWIQEAVFLEIEDGDFYQTGKNIQSSHQTALVQHQWR
jgi:lipopolysaccharide transport system ATP-binding protein